MDDRGLANRLVIFGAIILMASFLFIALNPVVGDLETQTDTVTDTNEAATGLSYVTSIWDFAPAVGLFLGVVSLLGGALFESRRGV